VRVRATALCALLTAVKLWLQGPGGALGGPVGLSELVLACVAVAPYGVRIVLGMLSCVVL